MGQRSHERTRAPGGLRCFFPLRSFSSLRCRPPPPSAPLQGLTHRLLSRLEAVHAHSVPGPIASSADGSYLFVAEAGVMAVIETATPTTFVMPKLARISSRGVRAVELSLDPGADLTEEGNAGTAASMLYVAGGRQGLWVMQADPRPGMGMPAARIDDAANATQPSGPDSRRWCNDVDVLELGSTHYLVALFSQWGCSHVRFYRLTDARDVLAAHPGEETGNELPAALEVKFGGNCSFQTPRHESFGFGLAVDSQADVVYVAMGPYGLVRIRFTDPADITVRDVHDGPWFGDGSWYANNITSGPFGGVYDDFRVLAGTPLVAHLSHAPYFMDVAIERGSEQKYLWCAVDHLGILRFDITSLSSWSTSMVIDHQEGLKKTAADFTSFPNLDETLIDDHVRVISENADPSLGEPSNVMVRNYAHRIRIANEVDPPALAVAVMRELFVLSDPILNEGRTLGHLGNSMDGIPPNLTPPPNTGCDRHYTLVYDLSALVPKRPADPATVPSYQHRTFLRHGGRHVHLQAQHPSGELWVFGGRFDADRSSVFYQPADQTTPPHATTFFVRFSWPAGALASMLERTAEDRPGRLCYALAPSPTRLELMYAGSNDQNFPVDGILATCSSQFRRLDYQPGPFGTDTRATFGTIFPPQGMWPTGTGNDYVMGVATQSGTPYWALVEMDPGSDLCAPTPASLPTRVKRLFLEAPLDNFQHEGRGYLSGAVVDAAYDAHVGSQYRLMFGSRVDTPGGIVVLNRAVLEASMASSSIPNDALILSGGTHFRELITHPEFFNVYVTHPTNNPTPPARFLHPSSHPNTASLLGRVNTYFPRLTRIPAPQASPEALHWALAVPCAAVQLPPDLRTFTDPQFPQYNPTWAPPAVFATYYDRSMVRVFDVHDPDHVTDHDTPLGNYTLIGPRDSTAAIQIEPQDWDGRSYLFVADFGGSLQVWDVTNLLDEPNGRIVVPADTDYAAFLRAEWVAPLSVSDDIGNNVWSIALDPTTFVDAAGERNELYVYVMVGRYGIEVLRFLPTQPAGQRLQSVRRIEIPYGQGSLFIRRTSDPSVRTLLVADSLAGLRSFEYGD